MLFFIFNYIGDKSDYELSILKKNVISLLNDNSPVFFEYDVNYFNESYKRIYKLYCKLNEFIINERIQDITNLDIIFNNITNNNSYLNEFGIDNNFLNIYNNRYININNSFFNQIEKLLNVILGDNLNQNFEAFVDYKSKSTNNNIFQSDNYFKIIHSTYGLIPQENLENKNFSLNLRRIKSFKQIKNSKKSLRKQNKFKLISKKSNYRGVTKNRKKWQAYIWINNKNTYLGSYSSQEVAAKIYDLMAIKKKGFKAKTNFIYNYIEINKIYKMNIDIKQINKKVNKLNI